LKSLAISVSFYDIPIEALPQTFKDAVGLTRALGVDIILIDSLRIIKNSESG